METASGNTMLDGPTAIEDKERTAENKKLVRRFVDDILVNGRVERLPEYLTVDHVQHNPDIPNGRQALIEAFTTMAEQGITVQYDSIERILGEGNFVLVQARGELGSRPVVFYDLFRAENGKLAEHWDVTQEIPQTARHSNGML